MRRAINFAALLLAPLLTFAACATAPAIPQNEYGLAVVPDRATYQQLVRADADKQLVDLATLGIPLDIRYATTNNFMHQTLYPSARAFLRAPAARALAAVERDLAAQGLGLKVFDAYRPYSITKMMWEPIKNPDFVADPAKGSRHNRGAAVDLTLISLKTGEELVMPTPYDDFTNRARQDFNDLTPEQLANRAKLREAMERHGFVPLPSEWWHFDFAGWERFELMDVPFGDVE
ncbi:MAG TPA: M15 family metallopeptidase [Thermoanaerobaculia bacterium]|nr:M15 family metallopeptidase [Thermoanaerobaculia bacterium]